MSIPELFKYDLRVRERLQRKRQLTESEVDQHLSSLSDVSGNAIEIELKQPALQTEAERAENSVIVRPAPPRPISIAAPILLDDEDDEDDEEDLPKPAPKAAAAAAAPAAAAAAAAAPAAAAAAAEPDAAEGDDDDDEDDEDEDDEDDEDEDEDDEDDEDKDDKEEPAEGGEL